MDNIKNPQLKNKAIFKYRKMPFGIPDKIFIITLILALFGVVVFIKLTGFLVGAIISFFFVILLFKPLIVIHENDNDAWYYWLDSLRKFKSTDDATLTTLHSQEVKIKMLTGKSNISIKQFNNRKK